MKKFIITLLFLLTTINSAWSAVISAQVDRNPVNTDETFNLFFIADESPDDDPDFSPLEKDFEVLNQSHSSNVSIINGKYSKTVKWTLSVIAKRAGTLTVPAIKFGSDSSSAIRLSVKAASQHASSNTADIFMELDVSPKKTWVQSQIVITLRFLSAINLTGFSGFSELKTEGVDSVIEPLGEIKQFQVKRGNRPYIVFEKRYSVFPQKSGTLTIPALFAEARLPGQPSSSFDPFQRSGKLKRVRTKTRNIDVLATDPSYKARHWLAASEIQLSDEWPEDITSYKAGEPITRTLTIMADGLTAAQLPEFKIQGVDHIKQYPDKPVMQDIKKDTGIIGMRQEKIAYIPSQAGNYTIPAITVSWWNTQTGKQETTRIAKKVIKVLAGEAKTSPVVPPASTELPTLTKQTVVVADKQSEHSDVWFAASLLLACGWLLTAGLWWRGSRNTVKKQTASRSLSLNQAMKQLTKACQMNDPSSCKEALLNWAQQRYPECRISNLSQLGKQAGEPLQTEIRRLEAMLYSTDSTDWDSKIIADICQKLSQNPSAHGQTDAETLEPLHKK